MIVLDSISIFNNVHTFDFNCPLRCTCVSAVKTTTWRGGQEKHQNRRDLANTKIKTKPSSYGIMRRHRTWPPVHKPLWQEAYRLRWRRLSEHVAGSMEVRFWWPELFNVVFRRLVLLITNELIIASQGFTCRYGKVSTGMVNIDPVEVIIVSSQQILFILPRGTDRAILRKIGKQTPLKILVVGWREKEVFSAASLVVCSPCCYRWTNNGKVACRNPSITKKSMKAQYHQKL